MAPLRARSADARIVLLDVCVYVEGVWGFGSGTNDDGQMAIDPIHHHQQHQQQHQQQQQVQPSRGDQATDVGVQIAATELEGGAAGRLSQSVHMQIHRSIDRVIDGGGDLGAWSRFRVDVWVCVNGGGKPPSSAFAADEDDEEGEAYKTQQ
jgi:hypothetical protein